MSEIIASAASLLFVIPLLFAPEQLGYIVQDMNQVVAVMGGIAVGYSVEYLAGGIGRHVPRHYDQLPSYQHVSTSCIKTDIASLSAYCMPFAAMAPIGLFVVLTRTAGSNSEDKVKMPT